MLFQCVWVRSSPSWTRCLWSDSWREKMERAVRKHSYERQCQCYVCLSKASIECPWKPCPGDRERNWQLLQFGRSLELVEMLGKPIELAINVLQLRGTQRVLNIVFKHKAKRKWENMSLETKGLSIFLQHLQNLVTVLV